MYDQADKLNVVRVLTQYSWTTPDTATSPVASVTPDNTVVPPTFKVIDTPSTGNP